MKRTYLELPRTAESDPLQTFFAMRKNCRSPLVFVLDELGAYDASVWRDWGCAGSVDSSYRLGSTA